MLNRLYGWLNSPNRPSEWSRFVDSFFTHEDFLPPLHQPNILPELSQGILAKISHLNHREYDYRQKEETVLKAALSILEKHISDEPYNVQMGAESFDLKESIRLYHKIEQLVINKGYQSPPMVMNREQQRF